MQPLTHADILAADDYARTRDELRRQIMVQKDRRRVLVGDHCSVHFENRDTLRYQVHEMLRVEHSWTKPGAIDDELHAYNPLLPGHGELSTTVMFEYETAESRAEQLSKLTGIDRHFWLVVGDAPRIPGQFDRMQISEGKISSVQFVRFALDRRQRELLSTDGTVVRIVIDHPAYQAQAVLGETTRKAIAEDVR